MMRPRVAVVSDLREERWHSMDLVADVAGRRARSRDRTAPSIRSICVRRWCGGSPACRGSDSARC